MSTLEQSYIDAINAKEIEGVMVLARDATGKVYSKEFGTRTLRDGSTQSLTTKDITFLASATKLITTIAALQCVEKGLLSLDVDVSKQLGPVLKHGVLSGFDPSDQSQPIITPVNKPITLTHLLTHSSGLAYDFFAPDLKKYQEINPNPKPEHTVQIRYSQPLIFQPGEGWMYGPGIDWAGVLVEEATGLNLEDYFRKHILEPVGVEHADFAFFPVKEGMGARMIDVSPKDPEGLGLAASLGNSVHTSPTTCFGGQGAYATGEAYIKVLESIIKDDERLLRKETTKSMFQPRLEPKAKEAFRQILASPIGVFVANSTAGIERNWGLGGLLTQDETDAGLAKGSLTWGGGINSAWFLDPTNGTCGFSALNLGVPGNSDKAYELKAVFRAEMTSILKSL